MFRYIVRRLLQMIPILIGITLITFVIINAAGSPLKSMEFSQRVKQEDIDRIRNNLGLDEPVWKRYFIWVGNVLQGDLGLSLINFRPVTERIQEVMFNTFCSRCSRPRSRSRSLCRWASMPRHTEMASLIALPVCSPLPVMPFPLFGSGCCSSFCSPSSSKHGAFHRCQSAGCAICVVTVEYEIASSI